MRRVTRQLAAADPQTATALVGLLCHDDSWRVRAAAATNPRLAEAMLRLLAADAHSRVRKAVARHPSLTPELIDALAADDSPVVRDRIAVRRAVATDADLAARLATSHRSDLRQMAAASAALPTPSMDVLASDTDVAVRIALAGNRSLSAQVTGRLAEDADEGVRISVAKAPVIPSAVVDRLASDGSLKVRAALAGNATCSRHALGLIATKSWREPQVLRALAANPAVPGPLLRRLAGHRWDIACVVAANPSCPARLLASGRLCGSHILSVRMAVAAGSSNDPQLFRRLARDNPAVRLWLATNPALPVDILEALLSDGNVYVRGAAAAHRSAPPEALARMAEGMGAPAWILRAIAANPVCPPDLSDQLLTWLALGGAGPADARFDPITCSGYPGETGTNPTQWYRAEAEASPDPLRHPLWRVRLAIPSSRKTTPYTWLAEMARDIRPEVRQVATRFPGMPAAVLKELSGDAVPNVAQQAAATLQRKIGMPETKTQNRRTWIARVVIAVVVVAAFAGVIDMGRSSTPPTTNAAANVIGLPYATTGPSQALPGGGTVVAGQLSGEADTYLTVTTKQVGLTVTIPADMVSEPSAASGYTVPPFSTQQFAILVSGSAVTLQVSAAGRRPVAVTVQLAASGTAP